MKITFLGTGTSQGVPVIAGKNRGIDLKNPKNWRTRTSAHIKIAGKHVQIDAGPEFRLQCLQNDIDWIDIFLLTHGHADHIAGMDDLRRFCDILPDNKLPVYSNDYGLGRIRAMFPYALGDRPASSGYPCFDLHKMPDYIDLGDNAYIKSTVLPHGNVDTLGFVFEHNGKKIAYYTDCKTVPDAAVSLAKNADILAIDFLRPDPHPTHLCAASAIKAAQTIGAKQTYFIHTTSKIDYDVWQAKIPKNCHIAYDGLTVSV